MACNGVRKPRKIMTKLEIKELGLVNFEETYQAMLNLIATKPNFHSIWLLEHNPVFTIGISEKNIREDKTKTPPFLKTDRGGRTTFHGPGQLVIYFILNMKSLPFPPTKLTSKILQNTLEVIESLGLKSNIQENDPGIFIEGKKVASIGMRIKKNYSYHGLSVNIDTDLLTFNTIKPCGLDVEACNLKDYIDINILEFKDMLLAKFKKILTK
ncbi:MAG: lipoyl(octanoyl) transferase LipB [Gammaproteobacteria bacterium]